MIRLILLALLLVGCSAAPPPAPAGPLALELSADEPSPQRVEVALGRAVQLTVRSGKRVDVHVHGFDVLATAEDGRPARLDFTADRSGTFDVEVHPDTLLVQLVVR